MLILKNLKTNKKKKQKRKETKGGQNDVPSGFADGTENEFQFYGRAASINFIFMQISEPRRQQADGSLATKHRRCTLSGTLARWQFGNIVIPPVVKTSSSNSSISISISVRYGVISRLSHFWHSFAAFHADVEESTFSGSQFNPHPFPAICHWHSSGLPSL